MKKMIYILLISLCHWSSAHGMDKLFKRKSSSTPTSSAAASPRQELAPPPPKPQKKISEPRMFANVLAIQPYGLNSSSSDEEEVSSEADSYTAPPIPALPISREELHQSRNTIIEVEEENDSQDTSISAKSCVACSNAYHGRNMLGLAFEWAQQLPDEQIICKGEISATQKLKCIQLVRRMPKAIIANIESDEPHIIIDTDIIKDFLAPTPAPSPRIVQKTESEPVATQPPIMPSEEALPLKNTVVPTTGEKKKESPRLMPPPEHSLVTTALKSAGLIGVGFLLAQLAKK